MVARQQREGERRKWKTRNPTENNGAAKRGKTADKEKNKKVDCVSAAGVVPRLLVQQKPTLYLQVDTHRDLLYFEVFNASLPYAKHICAALP